MLELIVSVCLVQDPGRCKDVHLSFIADTVTPHQCMMNGQIEIAKWTEGHPNWRVMRWTCGRPGVVAKA
jgi:hypothetical protein